MTIDQLTAWLNEPLDSGQKRYERITWLVKCNGGFVVRGWGIISNDGGPWEQGLDMQDAIDLIRWDAFFSALTFAGQPIGDAFKPLFDEYVARIEAQATTEKKP